jgi:hypothetical protein
MAQFTNSATYADPANIRDIIESLRPAAVASIGGLVRQVSVTATDNGAKTAEEFLRTVTVTWDADPLKLDPVNQA